MFSTHRTLCNVWLLFILATGRGGLWGCEMLRIPNFPDNRFTDGNEVLFLELITRMLFLSN
jgi:hypothetical protein